MVSSSVEGLTGEPVLVTQGNKLSEILPGEHVKSDESHLGISRESEVNFRDYSSLFFEDWSYNRTELAPPDNCALRNSILHICCS